MGRGLLAPWALPAFCIRHAREFLRTRLPCSGTSAYPPMPGAPDSLPVLRTPLLYPLTFPSL